MHSNFHLQSMQAPIFSPRYGSLISISIHRDLSISTTPMFAYAKQPSVYLIDQPPKLYLDTVSLSSSLSHIPS